jgi:hypothetical protein
MDFDRWYDCGLPAPLLAACAVCRSGVKRAHLVDGGMDGGLLLELYSRDGVGCMISTDFYEGIRRASLQVGLIDWLDWLGGWLACTSVCVERVLLWRCMRVCCLAAQVCL